jgi:hypothetical protein
MCPLIKEGEKKKKSSWCFAFMLCAIALMPAFGQEEYTLFYSGNNQGTVTIQQDRAGKITITPRFKDKKYYATLDHKLCPLIPAQSKFYIGEIKGGSSFGFLSVFYLYNAFGRMKDAGGELIVDPSVTKIVIDGTTTEIIFPDGWIKEVINGTTKTCTAGGGYWEKIVVTGTTTTWMSSNNYRTETTVDGNTTTESSYWPKFLNDPRAYFRSSTITTVDKQGHNIFIEEKSVSD